MQKLYCYVDETGQDLGSEFFVVVTIVTDKQQEELRRELCKIEKLSGTDERKWHKSRPARRLKYIQLLLEKGLGKGEVYFGHYQKPLPYFLPILETIKRAIVFKSQKNYQATVYIDGIDKRKAVELTNSLRISGVNLGLVKSKRDESEPLIRLADMWAGCIRQALLKREKEKELFELAKQKHYLIDVRDREEVKR